MPYTITIKTLPGKGVVSTEVYDDLSEAMREAEYAQFGGPHPVEITVTDHTGFQHYVAVHGER